MSTKKGKGNGRKKPPVTVTSEGDVSKADFRGLAARLLGISTNQEGFGTEVRGAVFESLQANVAGSLPPIDPDSGQGVAHSLWISVEQKVPDNDRMVEVWNTAIDQVEEAFFDTEAKRWVSPNPVIMYMFGEITHWREKSEPTGSPVQGE